VPKDKLHLLSSFSDEKSYIQIKIEEKKMKTLNLIFAFGMLNLQIAAQSNLEVNSVIPPPQSMNLLPTLEVTINFNNAVDITSINDTTFQVWGRWSGVHKGTIGWFNDTTSIHFIPDENFFYGEQATV